MVTQTGIRLDQLNWLETCIEMTSHRPNNVSFQEAGIQPFHKPSIVWFGNTTHIEGSIIMFPIQLDRLDLAICGLSTIFTRPEYNH